MLEGKHALSIINAVKNKLVLRAVAVIKSQTPYVDNFVKSEVFKFLQAVYQGFVSNWSNGPVEAAAL